MTPETIAATLDTLCDLAKAETMRHFRAPLTITNKLQSGFDPVTIADQAAETAITEYLVRHCRCLVSSSRVPQQITLSHLW